MKFVKWAAPVTYGASRFEVMTDEHHPRTVAVVNTLEDAVKIAALPELLKALLFYADSSRYRGPNQSLDEPDEWSESVGLTVYKLDVTRDGGAIARRVLGELSEPKA